MYDNLCLMQSYMTVKYNELTGLALNTTPNLSISYLWKKNIHNVYKNYLRKLGCCSFQLLICELRVKHFTKTTTKGLWSK